MALPLHNLVSCKGQIDLPRTRTCSLIAQQQVWLGCFCLVTVSQIRSPLPDNLTGIKIPTLSHALIDFCYWPDLVPITVSLFLVALEKVLEQVPLKEQTFSFYIPLHLPVEILNIGRFGEHGQRAYLFVRWPLWCEWLSIREKIQG